MTMYEPNPARRDAGAEVDEFVDAPVGKRQDENAPGEHTPPDDNQAGEDRDA